MPVGVAFWKARSSSQSLVVLAAEYSLRAAPGLSEDVCRRILHRIDIAGSFVDLGFSLIFAVVTALQPLQAQTLLLRLIFHGADGIDHLWRGRRLGLKRRGFLAHP